MPTTPAFVAAAPVPRRSRSSARSRAAPAAKVRAPRQGAGTRVCVVTRERLPRSLLFRVVRQSGSAKPGAGEDGAHKAGGARQRRAKRGASGKRVDAVVALDGQGRSAYVQKEVSLVEEATQKKRLAKALRCHVPKHVEAELLRRAREWQTVPSWRRGLTYGECFGADGAGAAIDEVQDGHDGGAPQLQDTMYDDAF